MDKPKVMPRLSEYITVLKDMGRNPLVINKSMRDKLFEYGWTEQEIAQIAVERCFAGYITSAPLPYN